VNHAKSQEALVVVVHEVLHDLDVMLEKEVVPVLVIHDQDHL
jgi:hypothetical protein